MDRCFAFFTLFHLSLTYFLTGLNPLRLSTKRSDTFRSFFVYGKEQESRKKYVITVQKKFDLPTGA